MEAFTLLKCWHTTGRTFNTRATSNTISDDGDVGPHFDLEFTPTADTGEAAIESIENDEKSKEETEFFTIDNNPSSFISNGCVKISKCPVSLLKSASKFEVDGVKGPLVSLFARDNNNSNSEENNAEWLKQYSLQDSDQRNLTKEMVHKYFKMLKPIRVSSGFEVVRKHLGKSRSSASSKLVVPPLPPGKTGSDRRDRWLLQQEDGIQGAILHCKRSFNASRDGDSGEAKEQRFSECLFSD